MEIGSAEGNYLFVVGAVDRGGVEQGFEEFDETEEKGTGYSRMTVCVDRAIVQRKTLQEIASHCEVELEWAAAGEVVPGSSVDIESVKHTILIHQHWGVRRSPVKDVCPARLVEGDYSLGSCAEDVFGLASQA